MGEREPFIAWAAKLSLWVPLGALCLYFLCRVGPMPRDVLLAVGAVSMALCLAALALGVLALCGARKHGRKGILVRAIVGVTLNAAILALGAVTIHAMVRVQEYAERQMALLRAKPFRFTPPPGFDEFPAAKEMVAHALLAFIKGDPTDDRPDIILVIEDLGGTIGKMDFSPFVQGRENVRLLSEPWGTHRVPVLELREAFGDAETLTYNAQVPLLPTAVQVKVVGVAELGSQLLETLREALKRLEGPTNW